MPRRKFDWAGISFGFTLLVVIVGALMTYAYLNGSTASKITELERRVTALEDGQRHK